MDYPYLVSAIGIAVSIVGAAWLRRELHRRKQVEAVVDRLVLPKPTYRTHVRLESDGSILSFSSRQPLPLGALVSVDSAGVDRRVGVVVFQEAQLLEER